MLFHGHFYGPVMGARLLYQTDIRTSTKKGPHKANEKGVSRALWGSVRGVTIGVDIGDDMTRQVIDSLFQGLDKLGVGYGLVKSRLW